MRRSIAVAASPVIFLWITLLLLLSISTIAFARTPPPITLNFTSTNEVYVSCGSQNCETASNNSQVEALPNEQGYRISAGNWEQFSFRIATDFIGSLNISDPENNIHIAAGSLQNNQVLVYSPFGEEADHHGAANNACLPRQKIHRLSDEEIGKLLNCWHGNDSKAPLVIISRSGGNGAAERQASSAGGDDYPEDRPSYGYYFSQEGSFTPITAMDLREALEQTEIGKFSLSSGIKGLLKGVPHIAPDFDVVSVYVLTTVLQPAEAQSHYCWFLIQAAANDLTYQQMTSLHNFLTGADMSSESFIATFTHDSQHLVLNSLHSVWMNRFNDMELEQKVEEWSGQNKGVLKDISLKVRGGMEAQAQAQAQTQAQIAQFDRIEVLDFSQPIMLATMPIIREACKHWRLIGQSLGLASMTLDDIEEDYSARLQSQKMSNVIKKYKSANGWQANFGAILSALKSPSVDENHLAERLQEALKPHIGIDYKTQRHRY